MTNDERAAAAQRVGQSLYAMCPEPLKPLAEMYLGAALAELPADQLAQLDDNMTRIAAMSDDTERATALVALGEGMGATQSDAAHAFLALMGEGAPTH